MSTAPHKPRAPAPPASPTDKKNREGYLRVLLGDDYALFAGIARRAGVPKGTLGRMVIKAFLEGRQVDIQELIHTKGKGSHERRTNKGRRQTDR